QLFRVPASVSLARARGLPRSVWGTAFAHAGVGIMVLGIVGETAYKEERILQVRPGETVTIRDFGLTLEGLIPRQGPNYRDLVARFRVTEGGRDAGVLEPAKRIFTARNFPTTEAALLTRGASQLYVSPGDVAADGSIAVRLFYKPFVLLIWIGTLVMVFGGLLSLSDRRLRIGAPKPAAKRPQLQAAE
ncbi:MAG: cytochrome c-type biogenesis CcmF C-terminal domain-containing protein, partial [Alphaproteobacteria bacterium]